MFIHSHQGALSRLIFSREFIQNPDSLRKISSKFVGRVLEVMLEKYDDGRFGEKQQTEHVVSWPYDDVDFPYVDEDE